MKKTRKKTPRKLHVAPRACSTCPYRRDTPPGVWDKTEYEKLRAYDENPGPLAAFHCHQENATGVPTVCRGWLSVHPDALGVRVLLATGRIEPEQVPREPEAYLYSSGTEACEAGLAGVDKPSRPARKAVAKLMKRRAGK